MTVKLSIKDVCKIFGEDSRKSLEMLRNGSTKEEILAATGQNVGVNNASFDIHEGEIFVIMGLSGSGKSTLVRMLNRLIEPTAGEILLNNVDIAKLSNDELIQVRRNAISMVFQSFALMPHMSVLENVCFGLELSGTSKSQREERALEALRQVGLEAYSESYPDELSGGMQQRVGLARALANDPEVLLMDEAFSALDPLIRTEMQDELVKLQADQKRTIVFISHDLDEAMRIGDRIAIMEGGRVVQVGTPDEILKNPADDYVRAFFRDVDVSNVLTAGDIATKHQVTIIEKETSGGVRSAIKRLSDYDRDWGYVLGKNKTFSGIVTPDSLQSQFENDGSIAAAMLSDVRTIKATESLNDIISTVASTPYGLPVINDEGIYLGVITRAHLLNTLDSEGVVTHGG